MQPVRRFRAGAGDDESATDEEPPDSGSAHFPPAEPAIPPGDADQAQASGVRRTALELATRIEEILDTAERSALAIQREAEASAQRYVEERRREADRELEERLRNADRGLEERAIGVARIGSSLRREAESVLERIAALEKAAEEALDRLQRPDVTARPRPASPAPVEPSAAHAPAGDRGIPEDALLRAAQMAIGGSERDEIERALRAEFGVEAPGPIVDEILGR